MLPLLLVGSRILDPDITPLMDIAREAHNHAPSQVHCCIFVDNSWALKLSTIHKFVTIMTHNPTYLGLGYIYSLGEEQKNNGCKVKSHLNHKFIEDISNNDNYSFYVLEATTTN